MMTNDDLEFVFQWVDWVLTQSKWCKEIGSQKVHEWTRQALETQTGRIILPIGATCGVFVERNDKNTKEDERRKKEFQESIKDTYKYWIQVR